MDLRSFLNRSLAIFVFVGISGAFLGDLYAADPAFPSIRARASALVAVESSGVVGSVERRLPLAVKAAADDLSPKDGTRSISYVRKGSGVIIDPRGILVTNDHIVCNAASISVILANGTRVRAVLIEALPGKDIAFLSIVPPFPLPSVPFADSDTISRGMPVYTLGRSLWHKDTLFRGKITGVLVGMLRGGLHISLLQIVFGMEFYLGDSGSPILDQNGKLLGLVMAGRRTGDKATFAVTSNFIRDAFLRIRREPTGLLRSPFFANTGTSFLNRLKKITGNPSPLVTTP